MFLFMYCNSYCPVSLKEQKLFEVIVPTSDYYKSNKKSGNKMKKKKRKQLSQKISLFAVGK